MITTDGAIKVQTKMDGKLYKQYSKKYFIIWGAVLALSFTLIALQIVAAFLYRELFDILIIISSGMLLTCSLIFIITMAQSIKKIDKKNCYNECEFFADYMLVSGYEDENKISENKVYYQTLVKYAELKDYFLAYAAKNVFYPISKQELTSDELAAIKNLLSRAGSNPAPVQNAQFNPYGQADGNPPYNPQPPQYTPYNENNGVFEDFPDNCGTNEEGDGQ